jgi:hypothetical protein
MAPADANGTYPLPYFGYGTLLGAGHMRERYPSAASLGLATYEGHELDFLRYDSADKGGCSIAERRGARLIGVLYTLSNEDMDRLLAVGGDAEWYEARKIDVKMNDGRIAKAITLRVNGARGPWVPPAAYGRLITEGAVEANLPADYRAKLNAIVAEAQRGR